MFKTEYYIPAKDQEVTRRTRAIMDTITNLEQSLKDRLTYISITWKEVDSTAVPEVVMEFTPEEEDNED